MMNFKKYKNIFMFLPLLAFTSQISTAMDAPKAVTIEALGLERDHVSAMTVSQNPTNANERYPISSQYVVAIAVKEMEKIKTDPTYVPGLPERKAIYICDHVFRQIAQSPATTLMKYTGQDINPYLQSLKENKFVSYNIKENTLGANGGKYIIKGDDLQQSILHMESRVLMNDITLWVYEYFKTPYRDAPDNKKVCTTTGTIVHRPNHALPHALKTAFIAIDILDGLASTPLSDFSTERGRINAKLVQDFLKEDPFFRVKVFMAAAYQRTGRESEISGKEGDWAATLYAEYLQRDFTFFNEKASELLKKNILFSNEDDIKICAKTVLNGKSCNDLTVEQNNKICIIRSLIWAGHMFELKRLANARSLNPHSNYSPTGVKLAASSNIFPEGVDKHGSNDWKDYTLVPSIVASTEEKFMDRIWNRMEGYLKVTGDRPMRDNPLEQSRYEDHFFHLANNPTELLHVLLKAQKEMA